MGWVSTYEWKEPLKVHCAINTASDIQLCLLNFQPFCDGSHKTTTIKPVRFVAEDSSAEIFLCGCKQTSSAPFCDGTHATEEVQSANIG